MRVLLTGADGYIGIRMGGYLLDRGYDVVGLDSGLHRAGWLYNGSDPRPAMLTKDTRDIKPDDLEGFDAIVHLAEVSNDPVGELNPGMTYDINHLGTVRLAETARLANVRRFVHMSSCSVYGASGSEPSREGDPTDPLTAYAKCKVLVERDVSALANDGFSPTFMRNATAYGASPRQRFDLVVNDLAATAFLYGEIRMASDGTPWRPFVHILDIAQAVACILESPLDVVHNEIFNVGSDQQNYQVRQIAEIVAARAPGCALQFGEQGGDKRDYRVDFAKITQALPSFKCVWDVDRGVQELLDVFRQVGLDEDMYRWRGHTRLKQIKHLLATGQVNDLLVWNT
jgi:nucleoside-diphosphate-sugar epimerase